jgi:glucokinase
MNIGSGIGGSLILNGRIHRGTGRGASEIGHLWMDYNVDAQPWRPREESSWAILEHRASGWAMQRRSGQLDVPALLHAMEAGNQHARQTWISARRRIALALSHVIALVCPRRIVLGGGVSLAAANLFLEPLREEVKQVVFKPFQDCYDIHTAALGEEVVVQGALILARQRFSQE